MEGADSGGLATYDVCGGAEAETVDNIAYYRCGCEFECQWGKRSCGRACGDHAVVSKASGEAEGTYQGGIFFFFDKLHAPFVFSRSIVARNGNNRDRHNVYRVVRVYCVFTSAHPDTDTDDKYSGKPFDDELRFIEHRQW